MKLAPEGMPTIAIAGLFFVIALAAWLITKNQITAYLTLAFAVVALFMMFFFRDPARQGEYLPGRLISPADGKVVIVRETEDAFLFRKKVMQVSVFLSPLDVHINWIPISGRVVYQQYHPGKFFPAFEEKASLANEQMQLGIETPYGKILMKQIAGILARRVVCYPKLGDEVSAGQRMGLMKFGSRIDLLLPLGTKINVKVGDRVKGGVTVIGSMDGDI
ncbi:MAG: phosphatidylserine decarboxylase [Candidatus Edwardsbacteria bacterium RIFOXYD12_FULL_50_11]|uniref:Phosphatidylserine decarboxylase proenzyme n=1 Tax=Candidatus Edwardsbacteria bacterium GWF2_54_11 TaxID=1817851 RepID=A0A1F5R0T9_9BACT|nr:MAG: phosphatidylserine decarboxylase [Candidatus Edwardsbacteria bacterium RifOxyC12_full_54_24]OGF08098.1 MAG: phosphatidylserine decarboxylase [Candidatus Edwardsbacteria bacterium GWF2_54_11]OGF08625.1 MAG: phosphatidylserine decarboxylase [Candidatus Edwardsbacteria bacterium RifOxyA12_full_54_48]OGF11269.1 MAG: phosphatidylserine decarboxylase [Candidatus Edwardsbacteria bacterium GWE2_54_12]OGF16789.1 MAG: phosphatidylserine decarboxylase [Candidatus Edwardsbacteria bacterium RIFOXYD1